MNKDDDTLGEALPEAVEKFRLRGRGRFSPLLTLALFGVNLFGVLPMLIAGLVERNPHDPALPPSLRIALYSIGMTAIVLQLIEMMKPGTLWPRIFGAALGADGIQTRDAFVPWSKVSLVVPAHEREGVEARVSEEVRKARPYGAKWDKNAVLVMTTENAPFILWVDDPAKFVERAEARQQTWRTAHDEKLEARPAGYREQTLSPRMLVRIACDGAETRLRRRDALAQLDEEAREKLVESLADRTLREEMR